MRQKFKGGRNMKKRWLAMLCVILILISIPWMTEKVSADNASSKAMVKITLGKTIEGNLDGGIANTYVIKPTKIGKLTITIKSYVKDEMHTSLYSSDNEEIKLTQITRYDEEKGYSTIKYTVYVSPRTYYLNLSNPIIVLSGSYKIATKFTAMPSVETKINNSKTETAIALSNNKFYRGVLSFDETDDYYCIKFDKKSNFRLKVSCTDETTIDITIKDSKGKIIDNGWAYHNSKIYSFDQKVAAGKYIIIINKGGKNDQVGRSYEIITGAYTAITAFSIPASKSLKVGDTITIEPTIAPKEATETYAYTSSDAKVAKVSSKGKITAVKKGTATITIKSTDGKIQSTCKVTVKEVLVTKVTLNKTKVSLYVGNSVTLKATVSPKNATKKTVSWKSSNTKIATVSSSGKVTTKGTGTCKITATAGGKSITSSIKVAAKPTPKPTPTPKPKPTETPRPTETPKPIVTPTPKPTIKASNVKSISMLSSLKLSVGDTKELSVTISPKDATNKKLTWSSTDVSIVSVESGKIICKKSGNATIVVTSANGKKAYCTIVVSK